MAHNQFELLGQRRFFPFFTVQALGAFNDNVFRNALIALVTTQLGLSEAQEISYTNLAPALFILPYFLFSALAGQIAERYEKSALIKVTTTMEIVIMSVACWAFWAHQPLVLMALLFATGLQSTLFGPVKYSILPQHLRPEELTGGNGLVEMGTSVFILLGMIFGLLIIPTFGDNGALAAGVSLIILACMGNIVSRFIPHSPANNPDLKIDWNPFRSTWQTFKLTRKQPSVFNAVLGISWFWFVGTILSAQLPSYSQQYMGAGPNEINLNLLALGMFTIGVGVGSVLCEKLSSRTIEIGLVPIGAFGMTLFCADLYFARPEKAMETSLSVMQFVRADGSWRIMLDLLMIGFSSGLYVVPLFAFVQSRSERSELSRIIAGTNIINSLFIVCAAALGIVLLLKLQWSIPQLFLLVAVMNAVVAIYIFTLVPEFLMRFISWVITKLLYRVKVTGIEEHVPDEGPALIVCNHVAFTDPLIIMGATPRPIRFVMYYKIFKIPLLSFIFRNARAIPIAGAKEDPAVMQAAFEEVHKALQAGEIVGIFPEGKLTLDGEIAEFKKGVEKILERDPVPVVPMAIRGLWGSMFSKKDSRMGRMRVPRRFRAVIELEAIAPVAAHEASAENLEAKVRALRGDKA